MIKKILIANRSEIACRVIRTAKKMGIQTVAIYSESDTNSLHVKQADQAIYVGPSPAPTSYLNVNAILDAVKLSGADAVHPGYGFLSENAAFAETLEKQNIRFIGPSANSIRKMGDKIQAKKIAQKAEVQVVPGFMGSVKSEKDALKIASKIGYPIMLKAAAGGGGKGIRIVRNEAEMQQAISSTKNEAKNNFADERLFIEKYIENPRHIEIQLLSDKFGNYICLGERECSIQRHHQKIIEESPSACINEKTRRKMYSQAIALGKAVGYYSVGTVEFIVDAEQNFYLLEMNTRLQVEHPVTELVTGIDIVEQMIRVANGEKLQFKQNNVKINGWAMECRICAEDPTCGFLPSTGLVTTYKEPEISSSIRVDTGIYEGGEVSMFYDAMIAKLCTHAPTRTECVQKMLHALGSYLIEGISTNISFLQAILSSERFLAADISTNFIDEEYKEGFTGAALKDENSAVILGASVFVFLSHMERNFTITGQMRGAVKNIGTRWIVMMDGKKYPVTVRPTEGGYKITLENRKLYVTSNWILGSKLLQCVINGKKYNLQVEGNDLGFNVTFQGSVVATRIFTPRAAELTKFMKKATFIDHQTNLLASISGMVSDVKVREGDIVSLNQPLVILEAMKMENILYSQIEGRVVAVFAVKGRAVSAGELLIEMEKGEAK